MKTIEHKISFKELYDGIPDLFGFDEAFLSRVLNKRIDNLKLRNQEEYMEYFKMNYKEKILLLDETRNSYSEFFREPYVFEFLSRNIARQLNKEAFISSGNREYRVWSMACAAGQEPYSLAILLQEMLSNNESFLFKFRIFATDISEKRIVEAKQGVYSTANLANVKYALLLKWFENKGEYFEIKQTLKQKVEFSVFDLLDDTLSYPSGCVFGDFHLVYCANVLYYYQKKQQEEIMRKIIRSLNKGGILVVSETERELVPKSHFRELTPESGIFEFK